MPAVYTHPGLCCPKCGSQKFRLGTDDEGEPNFDGPGWCNTCGVVYLPEYMEYDHDLPTDAPR